LFFFTHQKNYTFTQSDNRPVTNTELFEFPVSQWLLHEPATRISITGTPIEVSTQPTGANRGFPPAVAQLHQHRPQTRSHTNPVGVIQPIGGILDSREWIMMQFPACQGRQVKTDTACIFLRRRSLKVTLLDKRLDGL